MRNKYHSDKQITQNGSTGLVVKYKIGVFLPLQTGKGAKIRRFTVTKAHGGKAKAVPVQQREDETKECHKVFKSYTGNRLIQLLRYKHMLPFKKNEE